MDFLDVTSILWTGFTLTVLLFVLTLLFSLPLGLIISFGSMSKFRPLRYSTKTVVWIVRGVPLMLQVIIIFYALPILFDIRIGSQLNFEFLGARVDNRFYSALIAFVINYACYLSEVFRGGIESISQSQYEAGQVLGMTKSQVFFYVVLLQVIKRIMPPMSNEVITLVKDTALARVIMVQEVLQKAEELLANGLIWPLFYAGVFYLTFVGILTLLFEYIEKKLDYFKA